MPEPPPEPRAMRAAAEFADPSYPWPAPAKLNLFLHVVGRRADGYHNIQTLFQFLDLQDRLLFSVPDNEDRIVRIEGPPDIPPSQDLCMRAAALLKHHTGTTAGAHITVKKNIPAGAGLGGGSSCAATTLVALNHLWRLGLSRPALARLGFELGADVPVFIHGTAAFAEAAGEQLRPATPPQHWYLVLVPQPPVATGTIYADPALRRDTPPLALRALDEAALGHRDTHNDLQPVTCRRFPQVAAALAWLEEHCGPARMSGSGGAVFAAVANAAHGRRLLAQAGWDGFVARGVNHHPLAAVD